ncbi:hypothetical protein [Gemmatimonas sp.]|uniref:hypothetical protein n=1 Tax=Gemmatimonas sp. TaxID=1962908 RepID=UPI0039833A02
MRSPVPALAGPSARGVVLRVLAAVMLSAPTLAAQEQVHTPGMTHPTAVQLPTQGGHAAFAAISEIIAMLQANASTDWSKVNIERLRLHLVDMDLVTLRSRAVSTPIAGGAQFLVRGTGETIAAIKRMTGAHVTMVMNSGGPRVVRTELPDGVRLIVTAADTADATAVAKLRGLGFIGLMADGDHHAAHHLALARGDVMTDHGH